MQEISALSPTRETMLTLVNGAKARWLRHVMYESSATPTQKCFAYIVFDHLNCVTLDCWPSQERLALLLDRNCTKTAQRAALGLEALSLLIIRRGARKSGYRYAPVFLPDDDKLVRELGQRCPKEPDDNVRESSLETISTISSSTAGEQLRKAAGHTQFHYRQRQRGALELKVAAMFDRDGFDILSRLSAHDDTIVDRLCRALAESKLG